MLAYCAINISHPTIVWCDNQLTLYVFKNPTLHGRSKHIDIMYHFVRGFIVDGAISLQHCSTEDQLALNYYLLKIIMQLAQLGAYKLQSREGVKM